MDHWTSGIVFECSEIAGSSQGSHQQPTMSAVKPEGGTAASVKPGEKSFVRLSGIITLSGMMAKWRFGTKPVLDKATMINHVGVTNAARQC